MICNTNQPTSFQSIEPLTSNGLRVYSQKDLINKFTEQAPHPPYDSGPLKWKPGSFVKQCVQSLNNLPLMIQSCTEIIQR